jgi:uncharacterized membrane protein YbhN (UPF0104 family)
VPARVGIVAVGVELLATSAVIVLTAIVLGVTVAPDWWAATGAGTRPGRRRQLARGSPGSPAPRSSRGSSSGGFRPDLLHAAGGELAAARGHLRDVPGWLYVVNVPITLVNIAARVAILPLLAQALDQPPPLAATVVGSFALLYAQAVIPTPAGAGAVELGFLGGAAGNLGAAETQLLVVWRLYTTVLGTVARAGARGVAISRRRPDIRVPAVGGRVRRGHAARGRVGTPPAAFRAGRRPALVRSWRHHHSPRRPHESAPG